MLLDAFLLIQGNKSRNSLIFTIIIVVMTTTKNTNVFVPFKKENETIMTQLDFLSLTNTAITSFVCSLTCLIFSHQQSSLLASRSYASLVQQQCK